jgi:hypothetical protein
MRTGSICIMALLISGCKTGAEFCPECEDDRPFWEACFDQIEEAGYLPQCWDDAAGLGEALAAVGDDEDQRDEILSDWPGDACESADEVIENCTENNTAELDALQEDGVDVDALADQCPAKQSSIQKTLANADCDGFLKALGAP